MNVNNDSVMDVSCVVHFLLTSRFTWYCLPLPHPPITTPSSFSLVLYPTTTPCPVLYFASDAMLCYVMPTKEKFMTFSGSYISFP